MGYITELADGQVREAFFSAVKRESRLLIRLLHLDPKLVLEYRSDDGLLRNLWHDLLPIGTAYHGTHTYLRASSLKVVGTMLRLDLIPAPAREYAMDHVLDKVFDEEDSGYSDDDVEELELAGFFEGTYRKAFLSPNKDWAMSNVDLVREYIVRRPIDKAVAYIAREIGLEAASSLLFFFERHPKIFGEIQAKLGQDKISLERLERQSGYEFWEEQDREGGRQD